MFNPNPQVNHLMVVKVVVDMVVAVLLDTKTSPSGVPDSGGNGLTNTGGGGGGSGSHNSPTVFQGGAGGSGIVLIAYDAA